MFIILIMVGTRVGTSDIYLGTEYRMSQITWFWLFFLSEYINFHRTSMSANRIFISLTDGVRSILSWHLFLKRIG